VSIQAIAAVLGLTEKPATPIDRLVLLSLANHTNPEGLCWPSLRRISEETGLSRSTVKRAINDLASGRFVVRERSGGSGPGDTAVYRVLPDVLVPVDNLSNKGFRVNPLRPIRGSQTPNKGFTAEPQTISTTYLEPRPELEPRPNPFDGPDITPPEEVADHVAGIRSALKRPKP
jgi:DNA-binding transcriptional MocR family regulator